MIEAKAVDEFEAHTIAFKSFKLVTEKWFGQELVSGWELAIGQFSHDVRKIQDISIILKAHILEAHVVEFLNRQTGALKGKGLGFWSEQASESVHYDWNKLWVDNKYKRELDQQRLWRSTP